MSGSKRWPLTGRRARRRWPRRDTPGTLPLGTRARVANLENGRTETVVVEDRGPRPCDRVFDVSPRTAPM